MLCRRQCATAIASRDQAKTRRGQAAWRAQGRIGNQIFAMRPAGRHVQRLANQFGCDWDHFEISTALAIMHCIGVMPSSM
jgi:hypothetical protein